LKDFIEKFKKDASLVETRYLKQSENDGQDSNTDHGKYLLCLQSKLGSLKPQNTVRLAPLKK
jgi:hypothetical protein